MGIVANQRSIVKRKIGTGERDKEIAAFEKAIELNPGATHVMATLSEPLIYTGRVDEAIALLHRAMRLDPHHPDWVKWVLAWAQWHVRDCDTALSTMLRMAKLPNMARRVLAAIYVCLGRQAEAEATIAKFLEDEPDHSIAKVREQYQHKYEDPTGLERWIDDLLRSQLQRQLGRGSFVKRFERHRRDRLLARQCVDMGGLNPPRSQTAQVGTLVVGQQEQQAGHLQPAAQRHLLFQGQGHRKGGKTKHHRDQPWNQVVSGFQVGVVPGLDAQVDRSQRFR